MQGFIKSRFGKVYSTLTFLLVMFVMGVNGAFANTDTATVTAITDSFNGVKDTAIAILAAVGGIAILLFAGIYAWRYGKKVFQIIAK